MNYEDFKETIVTWLDKDIPDPKRIEIRPISKNNGEVLDALTIMEGESNISPTIYLNGWYQKLLNGQPLASIYEEIVDLYEDNKSVKNVDVAPFKDYDCVKHFVYARIINAEWNAELLTQIPHISFLDLAVIFYISFPVGEDIATINVDNSHTALWGVTADDLYAVAMENMADMDMRVLDINHVLGIFLDEDEDTEFPDSEGGVPMFVLTNKQNLFAAIGMVNQELLAHCAEQFGCDFYILPSSIHELILVPTKAVGSADEFNNMVQTVNAENVEPEERLADHAYYFNRTSGAVESCA